MSKSVKGTRTEQNLLKAFAGESQARTRYTFFASVAKKEGYEQIAGVFAETADQEKEHAKRFFKFLEGGDLEITASYPAGRITGRNLQIPAFEEFEETLRMLFFLIRSFRENTCDLLVTLFLGYACEKRITSPCLALAGECFEQVLLRPGTFNTFAHTENNLFVCVVDFSLQIYDKRTGKAIDNRYLFLMFALEFFISAAFCRRNIWTATNYVVFLIKYYTQFP